MNRLSLITVTHPLVTVRCLVPDTFVALSLNLMPPWMASYGNSVHRRKTMLCLGLGFAMGPLLMSFRLDAGSLSLFRTPTSAAPL